MKLTDEMIEAAALSDAEFDGRNFVCMGRVDRDRYMLRAKASLTASLSASPAGVVKPLKRYEPVSVCSEPDMHERENGDWVRYDDVFPAIEPAGVGVETDKVKDAFNHGYVLACCTVANLHDEPGIAFDVLQELGITAKAVEAMGLCEYDAAGLRKIEEARSSSVYRAALTNEATHD